MLRREETSWHHMTLQYGLIDAWRLDNFRKMLSKEFTFDNGRARPRSAVSRIDKFMISQNIEERGGRIETATSVRRLSDHSPLDVGQPPPPQNTPRFFNASLLGEEEFMKEMLLAWARDQQRPGNDQSWSAWLEATIERVMAYNTCLAKDKKRVQRCQNTCQKSTAGKNPAPNRLDQRGNQRYPFRRPGQTGENLSRFRGAQPTSLHS